jgi:hypothetical protein
MRTMPMPHADRVLAAHGPERSSTRHNRRADGSNVESQPYPERGFFWKRIPC